MAQQTTTTLALVGCGSKKLPADDCPAEAQYLYTSRFFREKWAYAEREADVQGILSAKYGFVWPDTELPHYDAELSTLTEGRAWADRSAGNDVRAAIQGYEIDEVMFLAGTNYRVPIRDHVDDLVPTRYPLEGMNIGIQRSALIEANRRGVAIDELEDY